MSDAIDTPYSGNGAIDWAAALATHRRWLRTVVFSRVADAHAVDEIMQNISMAVINQQPAAAQAVANVQAWLYRVAVRQSLMYRRAAGRERRRTEDLAARRATSNGLTPNPLDLLMVDEERNLMRQALERLRARDRELLLLKYTEGWTCRELSERLGIPVSTAESRLDRARVNLREELAKIGLREEP